MSSAELCVGSSVTSRGMAAQCRPRCSSSRLEPCHERDSAADPNPAGLSRLPNTPPPLHPSTPLSSTTLSSTKASPAAPQAKNTRLKHSLKAEAPSMGCWKTTNRHPPPARRPRPPAGSPILSLTTPTESILPQKKTPAQTESSI
ncbi:hypothetical protein EYF80_012307 [Liparis tanakae]|uniref:Uncharacterized protein n=1 Tax=Liparis tanakae TaxID=230148 RepID=A0A4Z2IK05_9TELE|nr:hypothetical protein EYF80_012307 [Liparis tanakae]